LDESGMEVPAVKWLADVLFKPEQAD